MCIRSHSESGQPCGFDPCEAYVKLLSEKSRLEGRCAGLELGNKINLERIKRQDERLVKLLAENEALASNNKRVRNYSTGLHDFIQWISQRHEHDGLTKGHIIHMAAKLDVGGRWQDDHVKFDGRTAIEMLEAENTALCQERDRLEKLKDEIIQERDVAERALELVRQDRDRLAGIVEKADVLANHQMRECEACSNPCVAYGLVRMYQETSHAKD